jgi:hypothetical protein
VEVARGSWAPFASQPRLLPERDNLVPMRNWMQAIALLTSSSKDISSKLKPPVGSHGRIVEIDETIYGRAATHAKGRHERFTGGIHKNVLLSLVKRVGKVRSYHVGAALLARCFHRFVRRLSRRSGEGGRGPAIAWATSAATTAWTIPRNMRGTRKAARPSPPTRSKATSQCSSAGCGARISTVRKSICGIRLQLHQPRRAWCGRSAVRDRDLAWREGHAAHLQSR